MTTSVHLGRLKSLQMWLPAAEKGQKIRSWKVDTVTVLDMVEEIRSVNKPANSPKNFCKNFYPQIIYHLPRIFKNVYFHTYLQFCNLDIADPSYGPVGNHQLPHFEPFQFLNLLTILTV